MRERMEVKNLIRKMGSFLSGPPWVVKVDKHGFPLKKSHENLKCVKVGEFISNASCVPPCKPPPHFLPAAAERRSRSSSHFIE